MEDSLLVRLRKYRPTENRDSLEDFVTESFCWLLGRHPGFGDFFLSYINKNMPEKRHFDLPDPELVEWDTQLAINRKRADMSASWGEELLLFEHKVWAELHDNQIQEYVDGAREHLNYPDVRIVVISATTAQHSAKADLCLCWEDVADLVNEYRSKAGDDLEKFQLEDFYQLLKHEGIAHSEPISMPSVHFYPVAKMFPDQLKDVLAPLQNRDWPLPADYACVFHNIRWGRLGLEFKRQSGSMKWAPGIFVGCVLFGGDHGIEDRLQDGMKLQIILSFGQRLHSHYPAMKSFNALRQDLSGRVEGTSWTFYDHIEESDNPNKYHTLYLEQPLKKLIAGHDSRRKQQDSLFSVAEEGLRILQASGDFEGLMNECDEKAV